MISRDLGAWLAGRGLLAADGAMGTALQDAGLPPGGCPEIWNLDRPDVVSEVLRAYVDAGAELIETNSFGGSPSRLAAHGLEGRCSEINRSAARLAREAAGDRALVLGSIGPTGLLLEPLGSLSRSAARDGFLHQAAALAEGGADALILETMTDLAEAVLAVSAAAETRLPVLACMTWEVTPRGVFTIFGASPSQAARDLSGAGACALGANCGTGPASMVEMIRELRAASSLPLVARPNAGLPALRGDRLAYPEGPEEMASHVEALVEAGASIIGGCCGTTPSHVRAMGDEVRRVRQTRGLRGAPR